jgi:Protein of unknown function (DUF5656)
MIWEFSIFLLTLIYAGVLLFARHNPANFLWPGIIFFAALFIAVRIITKKYFYFILPAILVLGSILLLPLIDSSAEASAFIAISAGVFYLSVIGSFRLQKYAKDRTAKGMLNLAALSAVFTWFASGYGWYLNIQMPIWLLMVILALITFFVSYTSFKINELQLNGHQKFLYAVFLAYLVAGTVWMQNFWPFRYLTTGVIALIIYYSGWDIIASYFKQKLSMKRLIFDIIFLVGASSLLLLSAKWYPVI